MADLDIEVRGAVAQYSATTQAVEVTTAIASINDYLLMIASVDFRSPAQLTAVTPPAGVGAWVLAAEATILNEDIKAWIAPVTSGEAKVISADQGTSGNGMHVFGFVLNPNGGLITVDGAYSTHADITIPYTHTAVSPAGAKDLLVCATGIIQFTGTPLAFGSAPSGMTAVTRHHNNASGLQACYQTLIAAGSTGTREQTSNINTATNGSAGFMMALRSEGTIPTGDPEAFFLAN